MARPRNTIPNFVSIDVCRMRQIASTKSDEELAAWVRKALNDMSIGCISDDVDGDVMATYQDALETMHRAQERKSEHYRKKKSEKVSVSTEVANIGAAKRNDQLIWGKFENVYLSQDEYNELATDFGNINLLNQVIESFSASLADGNTESKNHFATLSRWIAWRKAQQEKEENAPRRATFKEIDAAREHEILRKAGLIK